ncbi:ACT domain-containing protein [Photobacterium ganghwense]|uniref:ACT domain-containing protein n=1 Tax=Photobacterium ganghwense TaxID=320778 RepID=UPI0039EEADB7
MSGILELESLLKSLSPELQPQEYVFCSVPNTLSEMLALQPIATFLEKEGLTIILPKNVAEDKDLFFSSTYKMITLTVHSSLDAVGLTASVASKLSERGISANVIAAYYHDHIFVPSQRAEEVMEALAEFTN